MCDRKIFGDGKFVFLIIIIIFLINTISDCQNYNNSIGFTYNHKCSNKISKYISTLGSKTLIYNLSTITTDLRTRSRI